MSQHDITITIYWEANKRYALRNVRRKMKSGQSLFEAKRKTLEHIQYCLDRLYILPDNQTTLDSIERDIYRSV